MPKSLNDTDLYVILSPRGERDYLRMAEEVIAGGADIIQLRAKNWEDREIIRIGEKLREMTARHDVFFVINDRADLALILGADGVHLGTEDLPIPLAERLLRWQMAGFSIYERSKEKGREKGVYLAGKGKKPLTRFIGASTHSVKEAIKAEKQGASYVSIGPIFSTSSKPAAEPVGLGVIGQLREKVRVPFFAIGGINLDNVVEVIGAGAERIAVISAVCDAKNVRQATEQLKRKIREAKGAK